jgi:beta-glucanase (GH16 family)
VRSALRKIAPRRLDVTDNVNASGTTLQLWDCWGGPNQQWAVDGARIVGLGGKCLDVRFSGTDNGTPAQIWDCNGTAAQQWEIRSVGSGRPPPTDPPLPAGSPQPTGVPGDWKLLFADEFDRGPLDTSNWNTQYHWGSVTINNELESYVPEEVIVSDGALHLRAEKKDTNGQPYASGVVTTMDHVVFTYGAVETRFRIPTGQGMWPAFWLMAQDRTWPPELDIFEIIGSNPSQYTMTVHARDSSNNHVSFFDAYNGPDFSQDWHVATFVWSRDSLVWYVDGQERRRYEDAQYIPNTPMYVIANLAVGGSWRGAPDGNTAFPQTFDLDYVRVWQQ